MTWRNGFAWDILPDLLHALGVTVRVTLLGMALALVLGLLVAVGRHLRIVVVSQVLTFYVLFVRGTPLLVQAFAAYFLLPDYGLRLSSFVTGALVLGVNYSAYTAEVYRAGIEAVPTGQWEAATALNLPRARTWTRIVLPQSVNTVVPVLGNYLIQMFKDSAILQAIGVMELLGAAKAIGTDQFRYLEPITLAGILYLIVSYVSSVGIKTLERRRAPAH